LGPLPQGLATLSANALEPDTWPPSSFTILSAMPTAAAATSRTAGRWSSTVAIRLRGKGERACWSGHP